MPIFWNSLQSLWARNITGVSSIKSYSQSECFLDFEISKLRETQFKEGQAKKNKWIKKMQFKLYRSPEEACRWTEALGQWCPEEVRKFNQSFREACTWL